MVKNLSERSIVTREREREREREKEREKEKEAFLQKSKVK